MGSSGFKACRCTFTLALKLATTGLRADVIWCVSGCTGATAAAARFVTVAIGFTECAAMEETPACSPAMTNGFEALMAATSAGFADATSGFSVSVSLVGLGCVTFTAFDARPLATTNDIMIPVACFIVYLAIT